MWLTIWHSLLICTSASLVFLSYWFGLRLGRWLFGSIMLILSSAALYWALTIILPVQL